MKTKFYISLMVLICTIIPGNMNSQVINWGSLKSGDRHMINVNAGYDYGLVFGAGYGYQIHVLVPAVLQVEYSFPSGKNIIDDFKSKIGIRIRFLRVNNFQFAGNIQGVYRRNQNDFVRIQNFGSDLSAHIGYYRRHWLVAGEIGFDKAIITHLKHSNYYKEIYPEVEDGWFGPPTGGNFRYGLVGGVSMGQHDITIKAGRMLVQDFRSKPTIPLYGQLGYNFRF